MNREDQATTGQNGKATSSKESTGSPSSREWTLTEQLRELETKIAAHMEREHVQELEISSLRNEIALRFAYNESLEQIADERQKEVDRLAGQLNLLTAHFENHFDRLTDELGAVHEQEDQLIAELSAARKREEHLLAEQDHLRRTLEAERARISYRLVNKVIRTFGLRRSKA